MSDTATPGLKNGVGRTADYLSFQAALRPDAVALMDATGTLTFGEFQDRVDRASTILAREELSPGALVCVEWTNFLDHFILTLALERQSLASTSFLADGAPQDWQELHDHADLILYDTLSPRPSGRYLRIDPSQWEASAVFEPIPDAALDPECLYRCVTSSGTTGTPKVIAVNLAQTERRLDVIEWMVGFSAQSRFVFSIPFTFQGSHHQPMACLRVGGTSIHVKTDGFWESLAKHNATHTAVLPLHMGLIKSADTVQNLPRDLTITSYGGPVPDPLREMIHTLRPDIRLFETYATNEVGTVAVRLKDGSHKVCPGAALQVVDEKGTPLPIGEEGIIRTRKSGMAQGYIYNAAATSEKFRDGWFYPGDIGVQESLTRVRVLGREDDLLNIGGLKFSALGHERALMNLAEVDDACLLARPNAKGENELWIGIVAPEEVTFEALARLVKVTLPGLAGQVNLFRPNKIPRTTSGKIQRHIVLKALGEQNGG